MKQNPTQFEARQYMLRSDFEAFYYSDTEMRPVPAHQHSFYELLLLLEGDVTYQVGEDAYSLLPGDLLILPGGVPHHPVFGEKGRYRRVVLWLTADFVRSLPDGSALAESLGMEDSEKRGRLYRFHATDGDTLAECAMSIAEELQFDRPMGDTMSTLLVTRLLILIQRMAASSFDQEAEEASALRRIREIAVYIDENLHRDLTLDTIADQFFFSKFYLSRLFKRHMNMTPHAYITERRLVLAKQLLYEGIPPTEVSERCGYSDYSVFFRSFKKFYGIAPGKFSLSL